MNRFLLICVLFFFGLTGFSEKIYISGEFKQYPKGIIRVMHYQDYISKTLIQTEESYTDSLGYFSLETDIAVTSLIHLEFGEKSFDFYAVPEGRYIIGYNEGFFLSTEGTDSTDYYISLFLKEKEDFHRLNTDLYKEFYKTKKMPDLLKQNHNVFELKWASLMESKSVFLQNYIQMYFHQEKINLIGSHNENEFNRFEKEVLQIIPVDLLNPAYVKLLSGFVLNRFTVYPLYPDKLGDINGFFAQIQSENAEFRELLYLFAIDVVYQRKFYSSISEINNITDSLINTFANDNYRIIAKNLKISYNRFQKGSIVPDIKIPDVNNNLVSLADFKGKYILVDFFTTWCTPCVLEMKEMPEFYEKNKDKIVVVSISEDDDVEKFKKFVEKNKYNWIFLYDGKEMGYKKQMNVRGYPSYFLFDENGILMERFSFNMDSFKENVLRKTEKLIK